MGASPPLPGSADAVFAAWLMRRGDPSPDSFDSLLREHLKHTVPLCAMHEQWLRLEPVLRLAGFDPSAPASFAERLRAAHGPNADPSISLDAPSSDLGKASSDLLKRLGKKSTGSRYRLEGEVARGGMGAILRVWDEDIRRHLAMKVVLGKGEGATEGGTPTVEPSQLARFLEEAQVTGQLDHPGIVPVHELGIDQDGRVFFTMKLVRGRDLKSIYDLVFEGKEGWNEARALAVLLKVCEAVAYAHKKGVIHRDLKPANVMVGDFGEVYVMDWGLARVAGKKDRHDLRVAPETGASKSVRTERRTEREETPDSPIVTMDGDVVGTPAYMSPEQARGDVESLDARTDVYAIGAMIYHVLARQVPFTDPHERVSHRTVLARLLDGPPKSIRSLRQDTSMELEAIVEKAMARTPAARYSDTLALADDLRAHLEHRVVRAFRTGAAAELRMWVRRNRPTAAALSAFFLAVCAGALITVYQHTEAERRELLLSDGRRAEALIAEAAGLLPALPSNLTNLRAWIDDADGLRERKQQHHVLLANLEQEPAEAIKASILRDLVQRTGPAVETNRALVETAEHVATTIMERTVISGAAQDRWRVAADAIAAHPGYHGLRVVPQIGLLPLGADPQSGLWEFWHALSGNEPKRDAATGHWSVEATTGIVLVLLPGGRTSLGSKPMRYPSGVAPTTWDEVDKVARESSDWGQPFLDPAHDKSLELFIEAVTLTPFFISKYELTQSQWERVMGSHRCQNPDALDNGTLPVEMITWHQAKTAAQRLALYLPTEAQWEYACRGGTHSPFSTGLDAVSLHGYANIADESLQRSGSATWMGSSAPLFDDGYPSTAPVGSFEPNRFGLHDMHGNVWEWTLDAGRTKDGKLNLQEPRFFDGLRGDDEIGGTGTIRGGSWFTDAHSCRSAKRFDFDRTNSDGDLGVRLARPLGVQP